MPIDLVVVTPEGEVFADPVEQVVLPGSEGDFGVLQSHEKFLSPLRPGAMEIRLTDGTSEWAAISDGFAEVTGDRVVVLVDECLKAHEIDVEAARATQSEAAQALRDLEAGAEDAEHRARLENAAVRAAVHIEVHARR